jgi:hypothetical protein
MPCPDEPTSVWGDKEEADSEWQEIGGGVVHLGARILYNIDKSATLSVTIGQKYL